MMVSMHSTRVASVALIALMFATPLVAQSNNAPVSPRTAVTARRQLIGGVDGRVTELMRSTTVLTGGRLGMLINGTTSVAFAARAILNPNIRTDYVLADGQMAGLSFGYGGIEVGRLLQPTRAMHVATSLLVGGGATSHHNRRLRAGDPDNLPVDGFWMAEPEIQVQANVASFLRIAVGGSYRFVHGVRLQGVSDQDVRGAAGSLTFTFGRF
jgi:hypothetical protein